MNKYSPCIWTDSSNEVTKYAQQLEILSFTAPFSSWSKLTTAHWILPRKQEIKLVFSVQSTELLKRSLKNGHINIFTELYSYLKFIFEEIIPGRDMNQCTFLTFSVDPKKPFSFLNHFAADFHIRDEGRLPKTRLKTMARMRSTLALWYWHVNTVTDNCSCTSHVQIFFQSSSSPQFWKSLKSSCMLQTSLNSHARAGIHELQPPSLPRFSI